jgi:hypothetical protein
MKHCLTHSEFKSLEGLSVDLVKDGHKSNSKVNQNKDVMFLLSAGILQEMHLHSSDYNKVQVICTIDPFIIRVHYISL